MDVVKKQTAAFEEGKEPEVVFAREDELGPEELEQVSGGARSYRCPDCSYRTKSLTALKSHRMSKHGKR